MQEESILQTSTPNCDRNTANWEKNRTSSIQKKKNDIYRKPGDGKLLDIAERNLKRLEKWRNVLCSLTKKKGNTVKISILFKLIYRCDTISKCVLCRNDKQILKFIYQCT